jgi:hypothetical protein
LIGGVQQFALVSGAECVEALTIAGFSLLERTHAGATLRRGSQRVFVPDAATLEAQALAVVLRTAGMSYAEFLDLLGETPTDPAISRTRLVPLR